MNTIIDPIPTEKILEELTMDRFLRMTNNGKNEIYIVNALNAPNTMREIGRLREISFRDSGGGTGLDCDLDEFDLDEECHFEQLIVWNPYDKAIVGGYRFLLCDKLKVDAQGQVNTPTSELFHYSERFVKEYLPYTIELGRSFVQPDYQPSKSLAKGIYSLDNLWDGLGALINLLPQAKYFFGKVTMYSQLERESRDLILYFMKSNFADPDRLVYPHPGTSHQDGRGSAEGHLHRNELPRELQDIGQKRAPTRCSRASAGERLHEPFLYHALLWNRTQRSFRKRRGNGNPHHHEGYLPREGGKTLELRP